MSEEAQTTATTEETTTHVAEISPTQWRTDLGDIGQDPNILKINSVQDLAKSYIHQSAMVGKKGMEVPNEGWNSDQWGAFWDAGGRPKEASSYAFGDAPEGVSLDEGRVTAAKEKLHELGLSKKQGEALMEWHLGDVASQHKSALELAETNQVASNEAAKAVLNEGSGGKPELIVEQAELFVKNFGDEHLAEEMRNGAMGQNPRLALAMSKAIQTFNDATSEDSFGRVKMEINSLGSKASAQMELDRIQSDPNIRKALTDNSEPGHEAVLERWQRATKALSGF